MTLFTTNIFDIKNAVAEIKNSLLAKDHENIENKCKNAPTSQNLFPLFKESSWQSSDWGSSQSELKLKDLRGQEKKQQTEFVSSVPTTLQRLKYIFW